MHQPTPSSLSLDAQCQQLAYRLSNWHRRTIPDEPEVRRAAVVIALYERFGELHFLMIKRASHGSNAGQWALPGGRIDRDETVVETALRELHEETALSGTPKDVLGLLDDYPASRGIVITPVIVRLLGAQHPRRSPAEVASLHPLRLDCLTAEGVPRWTVSPTGQKLVQLPLRHDMVVHAPTGAFLWQIAEVALRGRSLRVADLHEPWFTAR